jgi:hypothetical protein
MQDFAMVLVTVPWLHSSQCNRHLFRQSLYQTGTKQQINASAGQAAKQATGMEECYESMDTVMGGMCAGG